jgi:GT2 family glycosyltransferase
MIHQIGIGIPTRDRWDELGLTLAKLADFGLGQNETIVLDDGSREPAPPALREHFPHVRFERATRPRYVTGSRNDLARLLSTPFFLQVDNDSFPVVGDLGTAAGWLRAHPEALALAFVIAERNDYLDAARAISPQPVPCHYFIGCGALLKRELFLELGGYEETLEYVAEEIALTLQAESRGLHVYQYPAVVVRHHRSPASRDPKTRATLAIRNELLIAGLHYPFVFMLVRWPALLLKALLGRWFPAPAVVRGAIEAARMFSRVWRRRQPLKITTFLRWKRMPVPVKLT